jgi:hypothetical protein
MTRAIITFCLVALVAGAASADLDTLWIRTYGGAANDGFLSAIPTSDGGAAAVGYTHSYGPADVNVFAVRTDSDGDTLWTRAYGGAGMDYGYGICASGNGGFIIAGYTTSFGAGDEDVYVLRLDSNGDTVWTRTYGGPEPDEGYSICPSGDGNFIVSGRTDSYGMGFNDLYLLKLSPAGDTLWTRVFGDTLYDWGQSVCETGDGNYGVCGAKWGNTDNLDIYVLKVAPDGGLLWDYTYGSAGAVDPDVGSWVVARSDTEVVVASFRGVEGRDPLDACFLRVHLDGRQLGYRRYSRDFYQYCNSICLTPDIGFLLCGAAKDETTLDNDLYLVKRVLGSGWVWEQEMGGAGEDWGSSVVAAGDGYYLISGHTNSTGAGGFDGWLLLMKEPEAGTPHSWGRLDVPSLELPRPNPVSISTAVRFSLPEDMETRLAVYDVSGRQIAILVEGSLEAGEHVREWNGRDSAGHRVSPGIYLVAMTAGRFSVTRKAVVLK